MIIKNKSTSSGAIYCSETFCYQTDQEVEQTAQNELSLLVRKNEILQAENFELRQAIQLEQSQTRVLHSTLSALAREPNFDHFLNQILKAIKEQLGACCCALWLYGTDASTKDNFSHLICSEKQSLTDVELAEYKNALQPYASEKYLLGSSKCKAVITNDIAISCYLKPSLRQCLIKHGIKEMLEVPLTLNHNLIGFLVACNTEKKGFGNNGIELAQALTSQVTLAIHVTHLAESAKQQAQQVAVMEERKRIGVGLDSYLKNLHFSLNEAQDIAIVSTPILEKHQTLNKEETSDGENKREKPPSEFLDLAPRERDVLKMIANGKSNKEIANLLHLSRGTVRNYVSNILKCLNVRDRTQAALVASNYLCWLEN